MIIYSDIHNTGSEQCMEKMNYSGHIGMISLYKSTEGAKCQWVSKCKLVQIH